MKQTILRTATFILALTVISCGKAKQDLEANSSPFEDYNVRVKNSVAKLDLKHQQQRQKWIAELKQNPVYIALVDSAIVSTEYLSTLDAISDAIKNTYIENGTPAFGILDVIAMQVAKSKQGEDKMNVVIPVAAMAINSNGGMPENIVAVFERYKRHFNYYGSKGDLVVFPSGKQETVEQSYNLSTAFALFDPEDKKALDAIFENAQNGKSPWMTDETITYVNSYLALKSAYMNHLKKVYPDSPYLLNVDFETTPEDLYASYRENEVAADEKFKNKKVAITGTISDIGKDITNRPYISFKVEFLESVTCYFSKENISAIAKLSKGDEVIIVGECEGLILKNVVLSDCKIWH